MAAISPGTNRCAAIPPYPAMSGEAGEAALEVLSIYTTQAALPRDERQKSLGKTSIATLKRVVGDSADLATVFVAFNRRTRWLISEGGEQAGPTLSRLLRTSGCPDAAEWAETTDQVLSKIGDLIAQPILGAISKPHERPYCFLQDF